MKGFIKWQASIECDLCCVGVSFSMALLCVIIGHWAWVPYIICMLIIYNRAKNRMRRDKIKIYCTGAMSVIHAANLIVQGEVEQGNKLKGEIESILETGSRL